MRGGYIWVVEVHVDAGRWEFHAAYLGRERARAEIRGLRASGGIGRYSKFVRVATYIEQCAYRALRKSQ